MFNYINSINPQSTNIEINDRQLLQSNELNLNDFEIFKKSFESSNSCQTRCLNAFNDCNEDDFVNNCSDDQTSIDFLFDRKLISHNESMYT